MFESFKEKSVSAEMAPAVESIDIDDVLERLGAGVDIIRGNENIENLLDEQIKQIDAGSQIFGLLPKLKEELVHFGVPMYPDVIADAVALRRADLASQDQHEQYDLAA